MNLKDVNISVLKTELKRRGIGTFDLRTEGEKITSSLYATKFKDLVIQGRNATDFTYLKSVDDDDHFRIYHRNTSFVLLKQAFSGYNKSLWHENSYVENYMDAQIEITYNLEYQVRHFSFNRNGNEFDGYIYNPELEIIQSFLTFVSDFAQTGLPL